MLLDPWTLVPDYRFGLLTRSPSTLEAPALWVRPGSERKRATLILDFVLTRYFSREAWPIGVEPTVYRGICGGIRCRNNRPYGVVAG